MKAWVKAFQMYTLPAKDDTNEIPSTQFLISECQPLIDLNYYCLSTSMNLGLKFLYLVKMLLDKLISHISKLLYQYKFETFSTSG